MLGSYNATGQYYRFAAADSASIDFKSKAISLVLRRKAIVPVMNHHSSEFAVVQKCHPIQVAPGHCENRENDVRRQFGLLGTGR